MTSRKGDRPASPAIADLQTYRARRAAARDRHAVTRRKQAERRLLARLLNRDTPGADPDPAG